MWITLQYFSLVTVVLGGVNVDNIYENLEKRNFLIRRAVDGSRGSKHFNPESDGLYENYDENEDDPYQDDIRLNVPGEPGVDYPTYTTLPLTRFSCVGRARGYYADPDVGCQVFHVCHDVLVSSFLCPVGSIFNQQLLTCDWWNKVDCSSTGKFYHVNDHIYGQDDDEMIRKAHAMTNLQLENDVLEDPNRKSKVVNGAKKNEVNDGLLENSKNSQRLNQAHRNVFNSKDYQTDKSSTDSPIIRIRQFHNGQSNYYQHNAAQNVNLNEQRIQIFQNEFQPSYAPTVPTVTTTTRRLYSPTVPTTYRPSTEAYEKFDQDVESSDHLYMHNKDIQIDTTVLPINYNKLNIDKDNLQDGLKKNVQKLEDVVKDTSVALDSIDLTNAGNKKIAENNRNGITKSFQNLGERTYDELSTVSLDVTAFYRNSDFGTTVPSFIYKNVDSTTRAEDITIFDEESHFSHDHPVTTEIPKYLSESTTIDSVDTSSTRIPKFSFENTAPTRATKFHSESVTYSNETPASKHESRIDSSTTEEATTVGGIDFSGNPRFITQPADDFTHQKLSTVSVTNPTTVNILNYTETQDTLIHSTTPYNGLQENINSYDKNDGSTERPEVVTKSFDSLTTLDLPEGAKNSAALPNSRDVVRKPKFEFVISPTTQKLNIYNTDIEYGSRIGRESRDNEPANFLKSPKVLRNNFRINVPDETSTQSSKLLAEFTTIEYRPYSTSLPLKNSVNNRTPQDDNNKKAVTLSSFLNRNDNSEISYGSSSSEKGIEVPATTLIPPFVVSKYIDERVESSASITTKNPSTEKTEESSNYDTKISSDLITENPVTFKTVSTPSTGTPAVDFHSGNDSLKTTPSITEENYVKTTVSGIISEKDILDSNVQVTENIPATGTPLTIQDNFGNDFSLNLREIEDSILKSDSPYQVSISVNKDDEIDPTKDQSFIKSLIAQHEGSNAGIFGNLGNFEIIRSESPDSVSPKQEESFKVAGTLHENLREAKKMDFEKGNLNVEAADSKAFNLENTKEVLFKSDKFPRPFSLGAKSNQDSETKIPPTINRSQQEPENPIQKSSNIKSLEENQKNQILRERILAELNTNFGQPVYRQQELIFELPDKERYLHFKTGSPLITLKSQKIETKKNLLKETTGTDTPTLTSTQTPTTTTTTVTPKIVETVVETEFIPSLSFSFDSDEGRKEYVEAVLQGLLTNKKSFDSWSDTPNSSNDKEKKKAEVS